MSEVAAARAYNIPDAGIRVVTSPSNDRDAPSFELSMTRRDLVGRWCVRWPGQPLQVSLEVLPSYQFDVDGVPYQLADTNPVSFNWGNNYDTVQTLVQFNGERIIWTTTNEQYPTIVWHWEGIGLHHLLSNLKREHAMSNILLKISKTFFIAASQKHILFPSGIYELLKRERRGSEAKPPDLGVSYLRESSKDVIISKQLEVPKVSNFCTSSYLKDLTTTKILISSSLVQRACLYQVWKHFLRQTRLPLAIMTKPCITSFCECETLFFQ